MFLLCYVDGEAIQQEGDKCFGVARCYGDATPCANPHNLVRSIALAGCPQAAFLCSKTPECQLDDVRRDPSRVPRLILKNSLAREIN